MPWFPNLRSQSPSYSEGLLESQKVSIAARLQQTKNKKEVTVIRTQMVVIQKESRPPSSPYFSLLR